jgi:hypothetical protein
VMVDIELPPCQPSARPDISRFSPDCAPDWTDIVDSGDGDEGAT